MQPKVAVQDDVNGFPRAGALAILERGIHRLFMGINPDSGGPPFQRPSAFWWKMPDGRRVFVYLGFCYPAGYDLFEPVEWRHGPVPRAGDTRYRPPRADDFLCKDEVSVLRAHSRLVGNIRNLEANGYRYPTLLLSITNQWRIDNDPPFPPLAEFVATWNRLKLEPTLRLTTAAVAMKRMEDEIGSQVPEHQGEWTDWWANGTASAPREVAASRAAKRLLEAADSPLWGPWTDGGRRIVDQSLRELCLFDEHTWGSSNSVALPYSLDTQAQFNRKASLAFRPMAYAEWLLSQRVRSRLATEGEGLYVANSSPLEWSGWVRMPSSVLRDNYLSLEDPKTGERTKLYFENGLRPFTPPQGAGELSSENTAATFPDNGERQIVKFWVQGLPGQSIRKLRFEHCGGRRGLAADAAAGANGWRGPTRLAQRDRVAGHEQAAVSARNGRLRCRAGERICPALGGEKGPLHNRRQRAGRSCERKFSKKPPPRPRPRRLLPPIRIPSSIRKPYIIPACSGPPGNWRCGRESRGRGSRCG